METKEKKKVWVKKVVEWNIPMFGNRHCMPYGKLLVTDGETEKVCKTKGDLDTDLFERQHITFNRKRYYVKGNIKDGITIEPAE